MREKKRDERIHENGELNEFAEVESFGEILHRENKYCTTKLKFCDNCGTELDWSDSGEKKRIESATDKRNDVRGDISSRVIPSKRGRFARKDVETV